MDDLTNTMSNYDRYRQALSDLNEPNKATLFDALAAANITEVHVDFDGEGDSGQINGVVAFSGNEQIDLPEGTVTIHQLGWGETEPTPTEITLEDAVEILCYGYLSDHHNGWENNDGAYGEFRFDVAKRTIKLEFNGRYTDTVTTNHSF